MPKISIQDLDLNGKRVFIRVDFNVPLAAGGQEITSDKRIRASLPDHSLRAGSRRGGDSGFAPRPAQRASRIRR